MELPFALIWSQIERPVSESDENFVARLGGMDRQGTRDIGYSTCVMGGCLAETIVENGSLIAAGKRVLPQTRGCRFRRPSLAVRPPQTDVEHRLESSLQSAERIERAAYRVGPEDHPAAGHGLPRVAAAVWQC